MVDADTMPVLPRTFLMSEFIRRPRAGRFPFVFVITFARTGSTLLQGLLNALPGYRIRGENANALFNLFRSVRSVRHGKEKWGMAEAPAHPWYGANILDPERFQARLVDLFVEEVLSPCEQDRVLGFKEIRYTPMDMQAAELTAYLAFLRDAFPGCGLIFNMRDPVAAAASGFWAKQTDRAGILELIETTRRRLEHAAATDLGSLTFDYDRWMRDKHYAERLFEYLGEPFDLTIVERILAARHSLG